MAVVTRPEFGAADEHSVVRPPVPTVTPRRRGGYDAERRQAVAGYLFIAPAMLIFFVFTLLPVAIALYLSFTDYDVFTKMNWIGAANYQDVFDDEFFWRALWNTLTYTVWSIPLSMAIGRSEEQT